MSRKAKEKIRQLEIKVSQLKREVSEVNFWRFNTRSMIDIDRAKIHNQHTGKTECKPVLWYGSECEILSQYSRDLPLPPVILKSRCKEEAKYKVISSVISDDFITYLKSQVIISEFTHRGRTFVRGLLPVITLEDEDGKGA